MKFDQKEKDIHDALARLNVDASRLAGQVRPRLHEPDQEITPRRMRRSMPAAAVIALVMVSLLVVTATAAVLGGFDWLMGKFHPPFAEIVEPVELSCEDQGIRMEIIGAQKYENMAVVYLSLQDISGQNRLTEQTSFRDGFWIKMNSKENSGVSYRETVLYFDQATNTIYYEFNLTADAQSPLSDPLEIGSSLIYFDQRAYEFELIGLSLADLQQEEFIEIQESQVWGGENLPDQLKEEIQVLTPGNYVPMPHGEKDQWVSNMGIIDRKLHVQIGQLFPREFGSSDMGLYLMSPEGEVIESDYKLSLFSGEDGRFLDLKKNDYSDADCKYQESIFTIDSKSLEGYQLCFSGSVFSGTEGKWKVTTNLNDSSHQIRILTEEYLVGGDLFRQITLSPLGVQATGSYQEQASNVSELLMTVETTEGEVFLGSGAGSTDKEIGTFDYHWKTDTPLDVSKVTAIIVNDTRIPMK